MLHYARCVSSYMFIHAQKDSGAKSKKTQSKKLKVLSLAKKDEEVTDNGSSAVDRERESDFVDRFYWYFLFFLVF